MFEMYPNPRIHASRSRAGALRAALAVLALCGLAAAPPQSPPRENNVGAGLVPARGARAGTSPAPTTGSAVWKKLSEREAGYLQRQLDQIRRWEGRPAGESPQPLATGALAAAALASQGGPDAPRLRAE